MVFSIGKTLIDIFGNLIAVLQFNGLYCLANGFLLYDAVPLSVIIYFPKI